jgi:small subunit ribosomal protein S2
MPQAVFVVDTHREEVAVREAVRMKIPVVGIVDTNAKPELVDYVIPANDDAVKSIELIVKAAADAVEAGKKQAGKAETQQNKQAKPVSGKEKTAAVKTEAAEAEEVVEEQIDKKVEEELGKEAKEEVLAKVPKGEK